ncbi:MAG TPA: NUDIX domain-containing protein [Armatimonadota bacterium]|jgi:ADP-ribose pyrophosphatase YjhB (NUDIX family)|nr:NUDIX domain-containing protein [Armatimonadota bacterium]HOM72566.1 NUDIX domain-containing protein [Armatimonadota bacterium]HOP80928.1 NUDIX domain-containing protein [Armatimonadota bacterium]HPP75742.1 NUDIX domain-containing protein [Armatimonadota bacterium]
MADFNKIGLLVVRDNKILLCREQDLDALILPGGTVEGNETSTECLDRELHEELGSVTVADLTYIGIYDFEAASDPQKTVEIKLYKGELKGEPVPNGEVEELVWFGQDADWNRLSPILVHKILPDLIKRKILDWSLV